VKLDSHAAARAPTRYLLFWLRRRKGGYLVDRLAAVVRRYGVTRTRAKKRIRAVVESLAVFGCQPTFPTPGRVVQSAPEFFREIQSLGSELALHGYDHVDFRDLPPSQARAQLELAAAAYVRNGIDYRGFRCPYLSYEDRLLDLLPDGVGYSSNKAIWWDVPSLSRSKRGSRTLTTMEGFYATDRADDVVSVPTMRGDVVEIPASLPDDLLLHDGLQLGPDGSQQAWVEILHETHRRGELFTLVFHPECFSLLKRAIDAVLTEAGSLLPGVWVARLRDIEGWWREKASFSADVTDGTIRFHCSERATILVRSVDGAGPTRPWHGSYDLLDSRTLTLQDSSRPLLGIAPGTPRQAIDFLADQGYLLDASDSGERCSLVIDAAVVERAGTDVALAQHIESAGSPLVRYWRWPSGNRSALSLSGDLDALSLVDYALRFTRLWPGRPRRSDQAA
jgi:hypothetical protein